MAEVQAGGFNFNVHRAGFFSTIQGHHALGFFELATPQRQTAHVVSFKRRECVAGVNNISVHGSMGRTQNANHRRTAYDCFR